MSHVADTQLPESLDNFLVLLQKGERATLLVPTSALTERVLELSLRSLGRLGTKAHLCTFAPLPHIPGTITPSSTLSLESSKTPDAAFGLFKTRLRKVSASATLLIDLLSWDIPWGLSDKLLDFVSKASSAASRQGLRTLWLVRSDIYTDEVCSQFKDDSDHVFLIQNVGLQLFGQYLKVKGAFGPELFLPRRIRISENTLEFDRPVLPILSLAADSSGGDAESTSAAADAIDLSYRKVFESSPDGLVLFDLKGTYREANRRALEMLGLTPDELRRARIGDLVVRDHVRRAWRAIVQLKSKGKCLEEIEFLRKSGRTVHVLVSASSIDRGRFLAVLHDFSGKKKEVGQIQESAEYYRGLFANSSYPQAIVAARKLIQCNDAFRDAFSLSGGTGFQQKPLVEVLGKEIAPMLRELFSPESKSLFGRSGVRREITFQGSEGKRRKFEINAVPLPDEEIRSYHVTLVDITTHSDLVDRYAASERRYRDLVESNIAAISVLRNGKIVFANQRFLQMFGYGSPGDLVGEDAVSLILRRERNSFEEKIEPANVTGGPQIAFVYTGIRKDGAQLQIHLTGEPVAYEGANSVLCLHRDVSEQKGLEDQVRRKAHTYQLLDSIAGTLAKPVSVAALVQVGLDAIVGTLGYGGGGVYVRDSGEKSLLLSAGVGLSEKVSTLLKEQSVAEGITGFVAKTHEALALTPSDYPPFLPYRSLFESERLDLVTYVPLIAGDTVNGVLLLIATKTTAATLRDPDILTSLGKQFGAALERAISYDRLLASETRYRATVEGLAEVAYQTSASGAFLYVSPLVEGLLGFSPSEFLRNGDLWRSIVHPDDRSIYSRRISSQSDPTDRVVLEYRMLPKGKAEYKRVRDSFRYSRDNSGLVVSIQGTLSEIQPREEKGPSLGKNFLEAFPEASVLYDQSLTCLAWNSPLEKLTGRSAVETFGKSIYEGGEIFAPDFLEPMLRQALGGQTVEGEQTLQPRDSKILHTVSVRFSPIRDDASSVVAVVGTVHDVTTQRLVEREVAESESRLREVINSMGDALLISDLEGRVVEVNREFTRLTGYSRTEVLGTAFPYPWLIDEETPRFVQWIAELREKRYLLDFDMTWRNKDGHQTAISLNTTLFRNASGDPVAMLNIARDITERRKLANELSTRSRQIEMLNRIISKANRTVDFVEIFETIAREVRELVPCDEVSVGLLTEGGKTVQLLACVDENGQSDNVGFTAPLEKTVSQLAIARGKGVVVGDLLGHPELGPRILSVQEGFRSQISIPVVLTDRILGTLNVASKTPESFTAEHLSVLQPVADQIGSMIDRSRLFRQVSDDSKYIHNLLNSIDSIVLTVDRNYRIRDVNEAWRDFADLLGVGHYRDEASVMGVFIEDVITISGLSDELKKVMPEFYTKDRSSFSTEVVFGPEASQKTYQLAINPMVINDLVTGLVFTFTDITEVVRAEAEIKKRNEELLALNAVSSLISHSLRLDEILEVATAEIRDRLQADGVLVYLKDPESPLLSLAQTVGLDARIAEGIAHVDFAARGESKGERKPVVISEGSLDDSRITPSVLAMFEAFGRRSLLAIPLQSKARLLGALVVAFGNERDARRHEERYMVLLGSQLGSAVENAQLYSELESQVQRVTTLYELGRGLTGVLDRRSVLELVHREVSRALPIRTLSYEEYADRAGTLREIFRATATASGEASLESSMVERIPEENSDEWLVIAKGRIAMFTPAEGSPTVGVPVKKHGRVSGLVTIQGKPDSVYTPSSLRLLESIANLTEIALDRVALYEDTVAKSQEIAERNRELDDFAYVVSHDLKEPLITIEGYSKIILAEMKDRASEESLTFLSSIVNASGRMKNLIEDLLLLSRVGRSVESEGTVAVRSVIDDVLRDFDFTLRQRSAEVRVPGELPTVNYDPTQLSMVFRNLISNAIKFNVQPNPVVTIGLMTQGENYLFSVQDNGIGIAREHFDRIFVIFQRLNRTEEFQGTGAGLTIVKKIVERHGGRIWLESEEGKGTTFFFTVPR